MDTHSTRDQLPPESELVTAPVVPPRSGRRATARRASKRRTAARQHTKDVQSRVLEFVKNHPRSTTGAVAKGLNIHRGTVAAARRRLLKTEPGKGPAAG